MDEVKSAYEGSSFILGGEGLDISFAHARPSPYGSKCDYSI